LNEASDEISSVGIQKRSVIYDAPFVQLSFLSLRQSVAEECEVVKLIVLTRLRLVNEAAKFTLQFISEEMFASLMTAIER
jgi:hypothetical protein